MTDGASCIRNEVARDRTLREAREIVSDMGLTFVRTLTPSGLAAMAGNTLDRKLGEVSAAPTWSEATDSIDTGYIAMEVSFTGKPAHPAIASVRNDREATEAVESGDVYWHPPEDRMPPPE